MNTTARYKKGKITVFVIEGVFQGKKTISYSFQKSVRQEDGSFKKSDFYSITDLQDLQTILQRMTSQYVKFEKVEAKPKPEEDIPF